MSLECRLCGGGAATAGAPAVGLYDKKGVVQVVSVVKECLPTLLIYRTDPLSKQICELCHTKVNEMYDFKKKVMEVFERHKQELLGKPDDTKAQLYLGVLNNQKNEEEFVPASPDTKNQYSSTDDIPAPPYITVKKFKEAKLVDVMAPTDVMLNGFNDDTNTTNTESDMELCDPSETSSKIIVTRKRRASQLNGPLPKKKRIIGPKSMMEPNPRIKVVERTIYNPLSLLGCCVDYYNELNGFERKGCEARVVEEEETVSLCVHCGVVFENEGDLASHELSEHIRLSLEKVDAFEYWDSREKYAAIRNKWFKKSLDIDDSTETDEEDEDDDDYEDRDYMGEEEEGDELLVRMDQQMKVPPLNIARNDNVVFVNEHPTINGIALRDIPRDKRHDFYQSVKMNGARRKFCNMCRYTFKDNWAIDLHYQTRMCYYTCHYCGNKFNKNKQNFTSHVEEHIANGDQKSLAVFVSRSKFSTVPKVLSADCLKPYIPGPPRIKGVIKGMNFTMQDGVRVKEEKIDYEDEDEEYEQTSNKVMTTADLARTGNKAYFCKKCYQVFTNLQEFNIHVTSCNGEIDDPELHRIRPYHRKERREIKEEHVKPPPKPKQEPPQELYSPTGRPVRTCVREVSYNDDKDFEYTMRRSQPVVSVTPTVTLTPTPQVHNNTPTATGRYECMMCSSVFPTVHSRNSHMRIHKTGYKGGAVKPVTTRNQQQMQQRQHPTYIKQEPADEQTFPTKRIKQETFEPIVEIHEGHSTNNSRVPTNIGSVSITPVRKTNGKPMTMSPAIMQLVQNNPNITIKAKNGETPKQFIQQQPQQKREELEYPSPSSESENKIYKCSSCSKPFNNKSNLYFHKKNHCNGSKYPCPFCKKRFGTEASYSSHIFYSHPV